MEPGESRCRQCGAVYGDDNYCPRCHNTTGVRAADGGYRCLACDAPRERRPGTWVAGDDDDRPASLAPSRGRRGGALALRVLGGLSLTGALLVGLGFAYVGGTVGLVLGATLGVFGLGLGALFFRGASKQDAAAEAEERARRELALVALAESRGGVLTVTDVARAFGLAAAEADALLTAMADGSRVTAEVTSDGRVQYVFRELHALAPPRARVVLDEPAAEEVEAARAERDERARRERGE
jgi:hypothetical protein